MKARSRVPLSPKKDLFLKFKYIKKINEMTNILIINVSEKKIKPTVDKVFTLANINKAFDYVNAQRQFGKVVISA